MHDRSLDVDRSRDGNRSREVRSELGYMIGIISSNWSQAYDWSHEIPTL
jgi:hypothetical protein